MRTSPNFSSGKAPRSRKPMSFSPAATESKLPDESIEKKKLDELEDKINKIRTKSPAEIASLLEEWLQNESE